MLELFSKPTVDDNKTTEGSGEGDFTSNISDLISNTTYYVRAYATNEKGTSYGEELKFNTINPNGEIAGHDYIDLGLPSGLKWATCNVGASSPEEYGNYYAWGETMPKMEYIEENCVANGEQISDVSGNAQYDAVSANWGGSWRMPTKDEMQELLDYCELEWTQINGVKGATVVGPNGSCIFLPAAGYQSGPSLIYAEYDGFYWSSTPDTNDFSAYFLFFSNGCESVLSSVRIDGQAVRPVSE